MATVRDWLENAQAWMRLGDSWMAAICLGMAADAARAALVETDGCEMVAA